MGKIVCGGWPLAAALGVAACASPKTHGTATDSVVAADAEVMEADTDSLPSDDPPAEQDDESAEPAVCKEGAYEGMFACNYEMFPEGGVPLGGLVSVPAAGKIKLSLRRSVLGEFYEVTQGEFSGDASGVVVFQAQLSGELNCQSGAFTGMLSEGKAISLGVLEYDFGGPLAAHYDHANAELVEGSWSLTVAQTAGACIGTWSAKYVGPDAAPATGSTATP